MMNAWPVSNGLPAMISSAPRTAFCAAVILTSLSACSELELEYTQAGYNEAKGCFDALMTINAIDRSAGLAIRHHGAKQALQAMHKIGPKIGEDVKSQTGASKVLELVALAKSDPQTPEIMEIEQAAETCAEKYGNPLLK